MPAWMLEPYADEALLGEYRHGVVNVLAFRDRDWGAKDARIVLDAYCHYHDALNTRSRLFLVTPGSIDPLIASEVERRSLTRIVFLRQNITLAERRACFLMAHVGVFIGEADQDALQLAQQHGIPIVVAGTRNQPDGVLAWQERDPKLLGHGMHHLLEHPGCLKGIP